MDRAGRRHKLRAEHTDFWRKHARAHRIDCIFPRYRPIARCCQPEARVGARVARFGAKTCHGPKKVGGRWAELFALVFMRDLGSSPVAASIKKPRMRSYQTACSVLLGARDIIHVLA